MRDDEPLRCGAEVRRDRLDGRIERLGGVQEEAPSLRKPVLVTRDSTERPEALAAGATKLIGTNPDRVIQEVRTLLTNRDAYEAMQVDVNPYGDGRASQRIVELALQRFSAAENSARAPSLIPAF